MSHRILVWICFLWTSSVGAAIYTVGPGGTHATVQGAIDAALWAPGVDEIRVGAGTYVENLNLSQGGSSNVIVMTGGWDAGFASMGGG